MTRLILVAILLATPAFLTTASATHGPPQDVPDLDLCADDDCCGAYITIEGVPRGDPVYRCGLNCPLVVDHSSAHCYQVEIIDREVEIQYDATVKPELEHRPPECWADPATGRSSQSLSPAICSLLLCPEGDVVCEIEATIGDAFQCEPGLDVECEVRENLANGYSFVSDLVNFTMERVAPVVAEGERIAGEVEQEALRVAGEAQELLLTPTEPDEERIEDNGGLVGVPIYDFTVPEQRVGPLSTPGAGPVDPVPITTEDTVVGPYRTPVILVEAEAHNPTIIVGYTGGSTGPLPVCPSGCFNPGTPYVDWEGGFFAVGVWADDDKVTGFIWDLP